MSIMLVAATGGHLAQLDNLAPRIPGFDESAVWVTFDSPQSRSLLADRHHCFVPYTAPRAFGVAARNTVVARRLLRRFEPDLVVSTGNAIAASFLPLASVAGVPTAYIESAARAEGPSLTGRLLRRFPAIQLYTQYESWADERWRYIGSIFDQFEVIETPGPPGPITRVLVTLGTIGFGFRRLVDRLLEILPDGCETIWQVGSTDVSDLAIDARVTLPAAQLKDEIRAADVVIAHAGIGSALGALELGKCPVLVPREPAHSEHVDDHQRQIAATLASRGLAVHRSVDDLSWEDLMTASRRIPRPAGRLTVLDISTERSRRG